MSYIEMYKQGCWNENCSVLKPLSVDHDHSCSCFGNAVASETSCGRCIRGMLCSSCNRQLGSVEAGTFVVENNPTQYEALQNYLRAGYVDVEPYQYTYNSKSQREQRGS